MARKPEPQDRYVDNYYSRTLTEAPSYPVLQETAEADVCVIGGGLAGLAVALGLAERGKKPVLLEARRIGWGASGRNGGFVLAGYSAYARALAKRLGKEEARRLYRLSREGMLLVRRRIDTYGIDCAPVAGHLVASWYDTKQAVEEEAAFLRQEFGENVAFWPREKVREICRTDKYFDGQFYPDCFHMNPLAYVHGIAKAIIAKGGRIFECSAALRTADKAEIKIIHTAQGQVRAPQVVYCGSAYFNGLEKKLTRSCLPIRSDVMVTAPIPPEKLAATITKPYAIRDNRWADDYYRVLPDNRILWGGGCALGPAPADLKERMLVGLLKIYPQLTGTRAEIAWSGLMGFTVDKMPVLGRMRDGVWACTNVGGQGLNVTTTCGELVAAAIAEGDETYRLFEPFGHFYSGGPLGPVVAQAVYRSWELKDWLGELWKNRRPPQKTADVRA